MPYDQDTLTAALAGLRKIRDMDDIDGDEFDRSMEVAINTLERMVEGKPAKPDRPRYLGWFKNDERPKPEDDPDFDGYPGQGGFTK